MTRRAIELLTLEEVQAFIGDAGLSGTFVRNTQQSIAAQIERQELQAISDEIASILVDRFPDVVVTPKRGQTAKVWLEGLPEEIE